MFGHQNAVVKVTYREERCENIRTKCTTIMQLMERVVNSPVAHYFATIHGCAPCDGIPEDPTRQLPCNVGAPREPCVDHMPIADDVAHLETERDSGINFRLHPPSLLLMEEEDVDEEAQGENPYRQDEETKATMCRMVQLQRRVGDHMTLGSLLSMLSVRKVRMSKRRRVQDDGEAKQSTYENFAYSRWGKRIWKSKPDPAHPARRNRSEHVQHLKGKQTQEYTLRVFNIECNIVFEILCVAIYINKILGVSHGDLLVNHLDNILVSNGTARAPFTIVDFDGFSEYREHQNGDSLVNVTSVMQHATICMDAATRFVASFVTAQRPPRSETAASWERMMRAALNC